MAEMTPPAPDAPDLETQMLVGAVLMEALIEGGMPSNTDKIEITGLAGDSITVTATPTEGEPVNVTLTADEVTKRVAVMTGEDADEEPAPEGEMPEEEMPS